MGGYDMESTRELIAQLVSRLAAKSPASLAASDGVYQFHLTGDDGGDWALVIEEGTPRLEEGTVGQAGVAITIAAQDFKELVAGRLNAMTAFMSGKLQVAGNMGQAMKLSNLL
jgi:putative sterol carrier protein